MFLVVSLIAAYAGAALAFARWRYRYTRPYTEPLSCTSGPDPSRFHTHSEFCYVQRGVTTSTGEAALFAILLGAVWPATLLVFGLTRLVTSAGRPLPEEVAARTRRLERELGVGDDS